MCLKSFIALLTFGWAAMSASIVNREATTTSDALHFFNECQTFSIARLFNGINSPDLANLSNRAISAEGTCEDNNKAVACTYLLLNRCYDNDWDGHLVPVSNGQGTFANTCKNCRANDPLRVGWLFCDCLTTSEERGAYYVPVETNMQDHLYVNSLGRLSCPGTEGEHCDEETSGYLDSQTCK